MADFIALQSCKFDKDYQRGDTIPADAVLPSRERMLIRNGIIAPAGATIERTAAETVDDTMIIPIVNKNGTVLIHVTPEDVQTVMEILQENGDTAIAEIAAIEKEDVLIMIDKLETRKTVLTAIVNRVNQIAPADIDNVNNDGQDNNSQNNDGSKTNTENPAAGTEQK